VSGIRQELEGVRHVGLLETHVDGRAARRARRLEQR
jgi:hypothetical protein